MNTTDQLTVLSSDFTALPRPGRVGVLHRLFREQWLSELRYLVGYCAANLGLDQGELSSKINRLGYAPAFSPAVYLYTHTLRDALEKKQVTETIDILHALITTPYEMLTDARVRIDTILTEDWEPRFVAEMRRYDPKDASGRSIYDYPTLVRPIISHPLDRHRVAVEEAIAQIEEVDPGIYSEYRELVNRIKLFDGVVLRGVTATMVFGAIYLRIPPADDDQVPYWIEHLVHEISHLMLELLVQNDRIVLNPSEQRFDPPIRKDPRPMFGVFHATFVLSRMVRTFRRLVGQGRVEAYERRLDVVLRQYQKGLRTVTEQGQLTPRGRLILDTIERCAAGDA